MDDRERGFDTEHHLRKISNSTARIDERTEHMERRLTDLQAQNTAQDEQIDELDNKVRRHGLILGVITFGTATIFTAIASKFDKLFHLI